MKRHVARLVRITPAILYTTLFIAPSTAWPLGTNFRIATPECNQPTFMQAIFREGVSNYRLGGICVSYYGGRKTWTYYAQGAYGVDPKDPRLGTAQEQYDFVSGGEKVQLRLHMRCLNDPWLDNGICSRESLTLNWSGTESQPVLSYVLSPENTQITPPFTASFLRRDSATLQAYRAQRQRDLAAIAEQRKREQMERLTGQPPKEATQGARIVDLMYRPEILSPGEGAQYVIGKPIMLMVKPPAKGVLGSTLIVHYQHCNWNQSRNACDWATYKKENNVKTMDAQAGAYQLRWADKTGRWRINVVNSADGVESPWRNFTVITVAQQIGPNPSAKGPVFGR